MTYIKGRRGIPGWQKFPARSSPSGGTGPLHLTWIVLIIVALVPCPCFGDTKGPNVRKPAFAGSFYPFEKDKLNAVIEEYLRQAESSVKKREGRIFGIMVPHAGYEYSGKVAAYAYAKIRNGGYTTVIIIGSSHRVPFRGVAIYPDGSWETPLGVTPVDRQMCEAIMKESKILQPFPKAFEREHSLEVQLPFLQKTLTTFQIVPILTGIMEENDCAELVRVIARQLKDSGKNILIVASSDMSHFHPHEQAAKMDSAALRNIAELRVDDLRRNLQHGTCELCGAPGVIVLMMLARQTSGKAEVLAYANSGDVTRDRSSVVGYGAVAFSHPLPEKALNRREQKILLEIARKTLEEFIKNGNTTQVQGEEKSLMERRGVFVTLKKKGELRGCTGYVHPVRPLARSVAEMTIAASSRDPRFSPVMKGELKDIEIEISVLSALKPIFDSSAIQVGRDGLYVVRGDRSGLLLPQVAEEKNWDREEFLSQTCIKAGLSKDAWKDQGTRLYTFTVQNFSE